MIREISSFPLFLGISKYQRLLSNPYVHQPASFDITPAFIQPAVSSG